MTTTRTASATLCALACAVLVQPPSIHAQDKAPKSALTPEQQQAWRKTLADHDYAGGAKAYAYFMTQHGRDVFGAKHTPLFVTGMNRYTGKKISPPFAHVKRKPFMPGWERDRELRGSDRNYGQADPLDNLTLLKIMHRLTEVTGDKRYAEEADKTASWWLANAQTGIGLYPWGSHTSWNVDKDGGGGTFEFNHVWPYWKLNPDALQKYAMGLWDHYVGDKNTGNFNRHANSSRHGPGGGMEFPWPGSAMIATWVEAYLANPDPEYLRAINTILKRWESLRDKNGILAPCSKYGEWAWYDGYMIAANRLDDWAGRIKDKDPELAKRMRDYGRKCDANYVKVADNLLDIKRVGPVMSYLRATGGYNPDRLDLLGGPWQDRKHYAMKGLLLHERMKRNDSPALQERYRRAVLDIAEVYMSVNPEVQWSVWGVNMSHAIELMMVAHSLTGNAAYLHRADHFGRLAVDLFVDEASPLPKFVSHDDFYEIESVTRPSTDLWMLAILDLHERLAKEGADSRRESPTCSPLAPRARPDDAVSLISLATAPHAGASSEAWQKGMTAALAEKQGGIWDCTELSKPAASVRLSYGKNGEKELLLSRRKEGFAAKGLPVDGLELIASDWINSFPTLEEVKPFNGAYRRRFSGKYREKSTASYGGFKDVLDKAGLLLVNHGKETATVTVTVQLHDSWDDRETKEHTVTLKPGAKALVPCDSPAKRFIRRLDLKSTVSGAVKLERFAFAMTPRSKLNPLSSDAPQASAGSHSPPPPKAPAGPRFGDAEPKLVTDGLVLQLTGRAFNSLDAGSPVGEWRNSAKPALIAVAEDGCRPVVAREGGRTALRFDGKDDFLSIADSDALDLKAWTLIVVARATGGPGVIVGKIDGRIAMMNYRLQVDGDGNVGAAVRGESARHQVNRLARANVLNRFAVITARFDPEGKGTDRIMIGVDGLPASYSYQNTEGQLTTFTHALPLEIGRQPGREPRYFKGDLANILLYNRALSDDEMNSTARWLSEQQHGSGGRK